MKTSIIITIICTMAFGATAQKNYTICIGGKDSGNITVKQLLADSVIHLCKDNMIAPDSIEVGSFKISIIRRNEDPILDIPTEGNLIPATIRNLMEKLKPGSKIFFENIRANLKQKLRVAPSLFTIVSE